MKKIIAPLALAASLSLAAVPPAAAQGLDPCAELGALAGVIMQARQSGTVMSDMIAKLSSLDGQTPESLSLIRAVILDAYNEPQWSSDSARAEAVVDFRNAAELACYQSF